MMINSERLWKQFQEILGLREYPLGAYYTNDKPEGVTPKPNIHMCMIGLLKKARQDGETVYFDKEHFGCPGGAYYMGFFESPRPKLEYFLSCGIPGEMEGERYVKTPELAKNLHRKSNTKASPREVLCVQAYPSVPGKRATRSGCLLCIPRYSFGAFYLDELFLGELRGGPHALRLRVQYHPRLPFEGS